MMEDRGIEGYRGRLNRNCVTIAEALKPAGYRNYAVGKWHVTPGQTAKALADTGNWPLQQNPSFPFSDPRPGPLAAAARKSNFFAVSRKKSVKKSLAMRSGTVYSSYWNFTMNRTVIPVQPSKRPLRRLATGVFHSPSRGNQPVTTPLSPQTPSLPVPEPANDATRKKQIPFRDVPSCWRQPGSLIGTQTKPSTQR